MGHRRGAAPPPVLRKTLLEWIEHDDGDTTGFTHPAPNARTQHLHAQIAVEADLKGEQSEPLAPPAGLRLAPLG